MGGTEVTTLEIDVPATRDAVVRLGTVVAGVEETRRAIVAAAALAGFVSEHAGVVALTDELRDEVGLIGRVLGLTADRAEAADDTYATMVGGWLSSTLLALGDAINDTSGASVAALIGSGAGGIPEHLAAALTPQAAARWFSSLPDAQRISLAAAADRFDGTAVGAVIDGWIATLEGAPLREVYVARALLHAGIDMAGWDPSLGLDHNAPTVEAVYEYYAQLYRTHPGSLWWSGMAALIGPSFYGGFQDIETFRSLFEVTDAVASSPLGVGLPPGLATAAANADVAADELLWYQVRLLTMQQQIFVDMAAAHEAYLDGGVATIERFYVDDPYQFAAATVDAWRLIDDGQRSGDVDMIADGNAVLLLREQQHVIKDHYDLMRDRPVTGEVVTWAMTLVGAPSVPGARSYPEVFPLTVELGATISTPDRLPLVPTFGPFTPWVPVPHVDLGAGVEVVTPLPDGNIADFQDRWALIEQDTLPAYVELARDRPEVVLEVLSTPISERAEAFTIDERIDEILLALATDWSIIPEVEVSVGW